MGIVPLGTALMLLTGASPAAAPGSRLTALELATNVFQQVSTGPDRFGVAVWPTPELMRDRLQDEGLARVGVQLPHREEECRARKAACWVVLYLEGFDGSPEEFHPSMVPMLQALDARPNAPPIVVLALDGRTRLGGGWYVDSPVSGRWETFVMQTLLPAAIAGLAPGTPPERVLVMGHSMGGFGALHLFTAHPKAFGAAVAFNPAARIPRVAEGALRMLDGRNELPDLEARVANPGPRHFYQRVVLSLAGAFFPDPKAPRGIGQLFDPKQRPWRLTPAAQKALARADVAPALARLKRPASVRIYAGKADNLIPPSELEPLRSKAVELVITDGDHLNHRTQDLRDALERLVH